MPESDWKVFRQLREVALQRFCERVLGDSQVIAADAGASFHARYLRLYRLLHERDRDIADAFNDPRRSRMIQQLAVIVSLRLLEPDELRRFTQATQDVVRDIAGLADED